MSNDTTQAQAVAPKATQIDLQALLTIFKGPVSDTRKAIAVSLKGGLSAACHAGVLAWDARSQGATRDQIAFLILGRAKAKESDGGEAKVYRAAMRLAAYWQKNGLPETMRVANNYANGVSASLDWLASHDVRSLEGLATFLSGGSPKANTKPLAERVGKAVENAVKRGEFSVIDASQLATKAMQGMTLEMAAAFATATADAFTALNRAAADAAARVSEETAKAA